MISSVSTHGSCQMLDLITMREVWSFAINDKVLYNNSKNVEIWSALGLKGLGLGALNKMVYWETDWGSSKAWKIRPKKLSIEKLID